MNMADELRTFKIDSEQWQAFEEKATANGTTASELLESYVQQYISDNPKSESDNVDQRINAILEQRLEGFGARLSQVEQRLDDNATDSTHHIGEGLGNIDKHLDQHLGDIDEHLVAYLDNPNETEKKSHLPRQAVEILKDRQGEQRPSQRQRDSNR